MCPACLMNGAMFVAGATGAGGLTALAAWRAQLALKREQKAQRAATPAREQGGSERADRA